MAGRDIGRNDLCPCGSGKKSKKCCLGSDPWGGSFSSLCDSLEILLKQSEEQDLESPEETQALLKDLARRPRQIPVRDLHGLSAARMQRFLCSPFDSPQLVEFPEQFHQVPDAPVLDLFQLLADAIPPKGLKPTVKGNLPRRVCRDIALKYLGEDSYRDLTLFSGLNSEEDYLDLHVVRIVSEQAGLIRRYRSKMILGSQCRRLLAESRFDSIYTKLFKTYAGTFCWEDRDPYLSCKTVQDAFLFSLYLLARYGDKPLPSSFYENCFLEAFPDALRQVGPNAYPDAETGLRCHYSEQTLVNFFGFFGLARVHPVPTERTFGRDYEVTKRSLFDRVVHFYLL